jgi:indolepyruvate ferredoxin oxidoreductase alpha subunit
MGNVAVARGAIEAGVSGVFSYPGTPSTEISEVFNYVSDFQGKSTNQARYPKQTKHQIYFEYSINEKIALEKAIAYSIGNKSAMCVMKNVGMNVASDALMSIGYQTIVAPLVIIVCDDPGCFSSSNEQDSRYWGKFASVPILNPSTPREACEMTKDAFLLSENIKLPVIVRMTTRVNHSRGMMEYNRITKEESIAHFERLPQHINIPARTALAHKTLLVKLHSVIIDLLNKKYNITLFHKQHETGNCAIISCGIASVYVWELLAGNPDLLNVSTLKIGFIHPFPEDDVLKFLVKGFKKVLVLEELDPIAENEIRIIAQKNNLTVEIIGKGFNQLSVIGEYNIEMVRSSIEEFMGVTLIKINQQLKNTNKFLENLPPRPPLLCAGCPHRATFYALKLAIPRDDGRIIMCGDIGCFGLGALPPLQMIDTINHMGMSVSMAQGLSEAMHLKTAEGKIVALLGDGTFFHSGVASLMNAIYTRANITVIIFDNRTIGMTGHQDHPGASHRTKYKQIDIHQLAIGLGVELVESVNPFDLKDTYSKIKLAVDHHGVSVLIAKAPCIFLPEFKSGTLFQRQLRVDPDKCNTCFNHCDMSLSCSRVQSESNSLVRARAKITATHHIAGSEQLCPANICNHGFFNAILGGDYKEALEVVRDKMLFAKVCGDICHKPCELVFRDSGGSSVPIKSLKHFVSGIEKNFSDFSRQISKAKNAEKKNKNIAVIGAGPAGLSSAYDLAREGYNVTVFECHAKAGGMIRYVIPDFRMDKAGLDREVNVLEEMGVQFRYNTSLGKDLAIENLSVDYDAVIIATGMWISPQLDIVEQNVSKKKKSDAISFLKSFNEEKIMFKPRATILVIGGGNSAMDAARSANKLNKYYNVLVSCIETVDNMPAFAEEIRDAMIEGIEIIDNSVVDFITEKNEKLFVTIKSFDKKETIRNIAVDFIITAIGQKAEKLNVHFETDQSGRVKRTGYKNIFFAGDLAAENHVSLIGAIGSGKKAAVQVRGLLENYPFEYEGHFALEKLAKVNMDGLRPSLQKTDSIGFDGMFTNENIADFVSDYNLFQACAKCNHCIENFGCPAMVKLDGKVIIDEARCTRCGLCIDVCPNGAIEWMVDNSVLINCEM